MESDWPVPIRSPRALTPTFITVGVDLRRADIESFSRDIAARGPALSLALEAIRAPLAASSARLVFPQPPSPCTTTTRAPSPVTARFSSNSLRPRSGTRTSRCQAAGRSTPPSPARHRGQPVPPHLAGARPPSPATARPRAQPQTPPGPGPSKPSTRCSGRRCGGDLDHRGAGTAVIRLFWAIGCQQWRRRHAEAPPPAVTHWPP
jgi:hypothetical protein